MCAELPDSSKFPHLHSLVVKHMTHDLCEKMNVHNPYMRDGLWKNHYPKEFCQKITHAEDNYPSYHRRDDDRRVKVRCYDLDNRWVVPYTPCFSLYLIVTWM